MAKIIKVVAMALAMVSISCAKSKKESDERFPDGLSAIIEGDLSGKKVNQKALRAKAESDIAKAAKWMMDNGRMDNRGASAAFRYLGVYGWYGDARGSFGMYAFSPSAFEQAKHQWWGNCYMEKGESTVYCMDLKFSKEVIGHTFSMYCSNGQTVEGKAVAYKPLKFGRDEDFGNDEFEASVKAPSKGCRQYGMPILSTDYVDMCECTTSVATK